MCDFIDCLIIRPAVCGHITTILNQSKMIGKCLCMCMCVYDAYIRKIYARTSFYALAMYILELRRELKDERVEIKTLISGDIE